MKTMNKLFLGLGFCAGLVSCSDFDEVNTNPTAAGEEYVKPQYALNNSIGQAQMNPGTAERVVVSQHHYHFLLEMQHYTFDDSSHLQQA